MLNPCPNAANGHHACSDYCHRVHGTPIELITLQNPFNPKAKETAAERRRSVANAAAAVATVLEDPSIAEARKRAAYAVAADADIGASDKVDTFAAYAPSKILLGLEHPDAVVETSSMASVHPPEPTYKLGLHHEVISRGLLSSLQLEAIVYASAAHQRQLTTGERAGFLLGDGAGIGKGRQIAGLVFENFIRGNHKAIWFSASADLHYDARRDFRDIGAGNINIYSLRDLSYGDLECRIKQGVIFCTYSCLISARQADGRLHSRLQQLVNWCGPDFQGAIVFDECHKAKNLGVLSAKGKGGTKAARAVVDIQRMLPNSRVVYVSATGGSELGHIGFMERLGLWGPGTAFGNVKQFVTQVSSRGVGAMEMVAMDMKARGIFMSRTLSFAGSNFDVVDYELPPQAAKKYDGIVAFWYALQEGLQASMAKINEARTITEAESKKVKRTKRMFWSAQQRFFRAVLLGFKVPAVIKLTKKSLKAGNCVVIGLQVGAAPPPQKNAFFFFLVSSSPASSPASSASSSFRGGPPLLAVSWSLPGALVDGRGAHQVQDRVGRVRRRLCLVCL